MSPPAVAVPDAYDCTCSVEGDTFTTREQQGPSSGFPSASKLQKEWQPTLKLENWPQMSCCGSFSQRNFAEAGDVVVQFLALTIWLVLGVLVLLIFARKRHNPSLRPRGFAKVCVLFTTLSLAYAIIVFNHIMGRSGSCLLSVLVALVFFPMICLHYSYQCSQLVYVFEWNQKRLQTGSADWQRWFYNNRVVLSNRFYVLLQLFVGHLNLQLTHHQQPGAVASTLNELQKSVTEIITKALLIYTYSSFS